MAIATVKLTANVKYNNERYSKGETIEIEADDLQSFQTAAVIDDAYTQIKAVEPKSLSEMTVAELKEYAVKNGIELDGATKKDDILAIIEAFEAGKGEEDGDE